MWYLILFLAGVFIGGFLVTLFDFGVKIQFVTGKSALPDKSTPGIDWTKYPTP